MTLRDYIGSENFRYSLDGDSTSKNNSSHPPRDGASIYFSILDRVRKQGAKSEAAATRAKTAGSIKMSHQSMLRMYSKRDPTATPAIHAFAVESLEREIE